MLARTELVMLMRVSVACEYSFWYPPICLATSDESILDTARIRKARSFLHITYELSRPVE